MPRETGSVNKNRAFLIKKLKEMFGKDFDPIIRASEQATRLHAMAMDADDPKTVKDSIDSWLKIGEFVMPKMRAMEMSMDDDTVEALKTISEKMDHAEASRIYQEAIKSDVKEFQH